MTLIPDIFYLKESWGDVTQYVIEILYVQHNAHGLYDVQTGLQVRVQELAHQRYEGQLVLADNPAHDVDEGYQVVQQGVSKVITGLCQVQSTDYAV